jgi:TPR repeat protein
VYGANLIPFVLLASAVVYTDPAFSSPDSAKETAKSATSSANSCFRVTDDGKSLSQSSCDLAALLNAAGEGQLYAENQLGLVSALVVRPDTDIRVARSWFEKAARRGYAPAQVNLAVIYIYGWGTSRNYGAALNLLFAAARQGHPSAYANLGILYMNGWGVHLDYAEARKYLDFAASAGDSGAQSNLGYLYDGGLGVPQDYTLAAHWYRLAAENGNALGQNNLADLYLRGQGVRQSYQQAFYWFEKGAQQGNTGARIKLGFLLMNGLGAKKDPASAYSWILAASEAGDHRGDEYLSALRASLDQQRLRQAAERARSLENTAVQLAVGRNFVP